MKKYFVLAVIALAMVATSCTCGAPKEEPKCDSTKVECVKKDTCPKVDTPAVVTPATQEVKK